MNEEVREEDKEDPHRFTRWVKELNSQTHGPCNPPFPASAARRRAAEAGKGGGVVVSVGH